LIFLSIEKYKNQYTKYLNFIDRYRKAVNASTGSEVDSNANVEHKNVTTCTGEMYKKEAIGTNRLLMINKITELYGQELAEEYIRQLDSHEIYRHDETNPMLPYCVSITMYPFLFSGTTNIGGNSEAPKHLDSFCGSFINLVYAVASQFAGAVATPEFLMYMDYFIRKDFGDDYYNRVNENVILGKEPKTLENLIENKFQQVVYTINDPAGARNFQSVFWNIAYFDKPYFDGMFSEFMFPDGSAPKWESVNWLQKKFMKWFNAERLKKILTFPVETVNLLNDGKEYVDKEWYDFTAEMWSEGHSFFCYTSNSVDALASCCRVRNEVTENTFSYTLGAGGISTGSKGVMTINLNRLIQNLVKEKGKITLEDISERVAEQVEKIHKYMISYNEIVKDNLKNHMLPVYDAGYISMGKQYLTIGINGFVEGAEFLGIQPTVNDEYFKYGEAILKPIYTINKRDRTSEIMFNTEMVPAENLGVKNSGWDKKDGLYVPRECYNSYFYRVEDDSVNLIDKFILHGEKLTKYLDGGSALHANLNEHLTKEQYKHLLDTAMSTGCSYFTFNVPNTICNECGHISKHRLNKCEKCGSENLDYATRVIGYLKRISNFSEARQKEAFIRHYE
jgi:ribonucleoside-triphosphate reductase